MGCGSSKVSHSDIRITATTPHNTNNNDQKNIPKDDEEPIVKTSLNDYQNDRSDTKLKISFSTETFKQKKKKLIPSGDLLRSADERALQMESTPSLSLEKLAEYLIKPFSSSDLLKLRVIWRWVTHNIKYDVDSYFNPKQKDTDSADPTDTLLTSKAVCDGYSSIFKSLADIAELRVETVTGWAKGYSYILGTNFNEQDINHAWNAVFVQDNWWLLDSTWGAGYVNSNEEFITEYNEHYFLTDPKEFIFDHFPEDPKWQLIDPKITMSTYETFAKFSKYFFQLKLKPVTHLNWNIVSQNGKVHIKFKFDKDYPVKCIGKLLKEGTKDESDQYLHIYATDKIMHVLINLPCQGKYTLQLFAGSALEDGNNKESYPLICSYGIDCIIKVERCSIYPKQFKKWSTGFYLHSPKNGELFVGETHKFSLSLPGVSEMALCLGGSRSSWLKLPNINGNLWEGEVLMEEGTERVNIVAKFSDEKNTTFSSVLEYKVLPMIASIS